MCCAADHFAVGGAGWDHREDIFGGGDGRVDQVGAGRCERASERLDGIDASAEAEVNHNATTDEDAANRECESPEALGVRVAESLLADGAADMIRQSRDS